jgi:hypothetical protein
VSPDSGNIRLVRSALLGDGASSRQMRSMNGSRRRWQTSVCTCASGRLVAGIRNEATTIPVQSGLIAVVGCGDTSLLHRLQRELIDAITPFTERAGTAAAFMSTEDNRDIQPSLISYVADFVSVAAGEKFNPHVTIGVATETYLKEMLAEPFQAFTFSPMGTSVYQLGSFGTARKKLRALA